MKTLVISDIHGCAKEFLGLLHEAGCDFHKDKLVLLGDYIDRGPNSFAVLEMVKSLQRNYGKNQVIALRGNHEQMALDYSEKLYEEYFDFFESLPIYYEDEHRIYVHAGLRPGISLENQTEHDMLWIRDEFFEYYAGHKQVVFGHTPTITMNRSLKPVFFENAIAIDTGCAYGFALTAAIFEDSQYKGCTQENIKISV